MVSTDRLKRLLDIAGAQVDGRAVTALLFVSPNGDGTDGHSWDQAYTTLPGALNAASTDVNECTLIMVGINTGNIHYDMATDGDPTWTGNYIIQGTHRTWAKIMNTGDGGVPTSVMKFTGYVGLKNININMGTANHGVIVTKSAFRVDKCQFVGEDVTGAVKNALHIVGASVLKHGIVRECSWRGDSTYMKGLVLDNVCCSIFERLQFHDCLTGIQVLNANSVGNSFLTVDIGGCDDTVGVEGTDGVAIDIDAGVGQHLDSVSLHGNTTNIDDEVGGHNYNNIIGEFLISITPDDFTGIELPTEVGGGTDWGADTQIIASLTRPAKVVGVIAEGDAAELFRVRISNDSGSTFFTDVQFKGAVNEYKSIPSQATTGTDFVFNTGDRISASAKSESGSNSAFVWLKLQYI